MLYDRTMYLDSNIEYLTNVEIIEYDIKSAGFNIIRRFNLLDKDKIDYLESLGKKERQYQIGLYQRNDKTLAKKLNDGFRECRKMFFESNKIKNEEVLSIKKDAIFVMRRCKSCEFDNIKFVEKNIYTSYYFLGGNELYYNENTLDIKGIDDELLEKHRNYMLSFLSNIFYAMEASSLDYTIKTIVDFSNYYKNKALEIGYYRELNNKSLYRLKQNSDYHLFKDTLGLLETGSLKDIDISYNYINYVVPLISILI